MVTLVKQKKPREVALVTGGGGLRYTRKKRDREKEKLKESKNHV